MKQDTEQPGIRTSAPGNGLEGHIVEVGKDLYITIGQVLDAMPEGPQGPQALARTLGVDKVLTSRLLKAVRTRDPMAVTHHIPGPEPLRRVLRAASKRGVPGDVIASANAAVSRFEQLIRREVGDRSALDAIISSWLPEARREFELRRKQSAFKAMSQLRGSMAETNLATVLIHPSEDGEHLDILWIMGLLGLQRLRPGVTAKLTSRRIADDGAPRRPVSLEGHPLDSVEDARLDDFCDAPPARLDVVQAGEAIHYTLGGDDFGPHSAVDLVLAEVNLNEIPRYVPRNSGRKGHVFAEIGTPSKSLLFDVLVHEDVYPQSEPALMIYDTALDGVANINDPTRDIDRMDMVETISMLGRGTAMLRHARVPRYVELLRHVFTSMGWDEAAFRGYRCTIDYPVYGSQVTMAFDPPSLSAP
jgi:hypothetical protein